MAYTDVTVDHITIGQSTKYLEDREARANKAEGKDISFAVDAEYQISGSFKDAGGNAHTIIFPGGDSIQVSALPAASVSELGKIYQYTGATTSTYTHGYFYECVNDSGTYKWENVQVSEGGGGSVTFVEPPVVTVGTYSYDGTAQGPTITGLDTDHCVTTNATATDAGTYTLTIALKNSTSMVWKDLTNTPKTYEYTIDKVAGSITLSKSSVAFNSSTSSDTVTVTNATGAVTVTSSDATVAEASISNDTITLTSPDEKSGTATITVSVAASTNYLATSATIAVTAEFSQIYGAEWDGTSTTAWSRTDAAAGFTDPVPYVAGATNYGSPFDNISPWKDMTVSDRTGGKMVKIPKFYYKLTQNGAGMKVQISATQESGFSVSPAHADRGDGNGERDVVYIGRYHCHTSDWKSKTGGLPKANITRSEARTGIHSLGTDIWQSDFATRFTLWLLYIVEFADWNSQAKIGYGCGNNSAAQNMGYTDSMPYHTGTDQANRTTYGGTQYRSIEGLWDNVYDWCDGCYNNASGLNIILNPNDFSDSANGICVGLPTSGYPSEFTVEDVSGTFTLFIPTTSNGSDSTYSCDYWNFNASSPCLFVGGNYSQGQDRGLFYVSRSSASYKSADHGCRLLELP